jgi:hypothetical protein
VTAASGRARGVSDRRHACNTAHRPTMPLLPCRGKRQDQAAGAATRGALAHDARCCLSRDCDIPASGKNFSMTRVPGLCAGVVGDTHMTFLGTASAILRSPRVPFRRRDVYVSAQQCDQATDVIRARIMITARAAGRPPAGRQGQCRQGRQAMAVGILMRCGFGPAGGRGRRWPGNPRRLWRRRECGA